MQKKEPLVYIILVNYNGADDTVACLNSLRKIDYKNKKIIIIDNASTDNSLDVLYSFLNDDVLLFGLNENIGFAGGNNVGIKYAMGHKADYVLLLNNDTEVEPDFLTHLVVKAEESPSIGVVGGRINYFSEKEKVWFLGGKINKFSGKTRHLFLNKTNKQKLPITAFDTEYITGCMMLVRADVIKIVGTMKEDYFLYYEETDWCAKINKAGYRLVIEPKSIIYHKISSSTKKISNIVSYYYDRNSYFFIVDNYSYINKAFMYVYKRIFLILKYLKFTLKRDKVKCGYIKRAYYSIKHREMGKYHD